jgi:hypothetical protein
MRGLLLILCISLVHGCGCSKTGLEGRTDAASEPVHDPPEDLEHEEPCRDEDGDTHPDEACGGDDCDDSDPAVHPGAWEVCGDGVDNDCDGEVDETSLSCPGIMLNDVLCYGGCGEPDLEWTGTESLVAWANPGMMLERVDADGVDGGEDMRLAIPDRTHLPGLAWTGSELGMTWHDLSGTHSMYFGRFDAEGTSLADPVMVRDFQYRSTLLWTGSAFGLAWVDEPEPEAGEELHFTTLSPLGEETGTDVVINEPEAGAWIAHPVTEKRPVVIWHGSGYAATWRKWTDDPESSVILLRELGADGIPLDPEVEIARGMIQQPRLAWTGSELVVTWIHINDLHMARIAPGGEVLDSRVLLTPDGAT